MASQSPSCSGPLRLPAPRRLEAQCWATLRWTGRQKCFHVKTTNRLLPITVCLVYILIPDNWSQDVHHRAAACSGLSSTAKRLNAQQGLRIPDLKHLKKKRKKKKTLVPKVPIIQHSQVFCQGLSVCFKKKKKGPSFSNWDCPPTRYSCISHSGRSLALTSTFSHTSQTSSSARRSRTWWCAAISQVDLWFSPCGQTDVRTHCFVSGDNYENEHDRMQQLLQ